MNTTIPPCSSSRIQAAKARLAAQTTAMAVVAAAALAPNTAEAFVSQQVFTPETPITLSSMGDLLLINPYSLFTTTDYFNPGSALLFIYGSSLSPSDLPGGPEVSFVSLATTVIGEYSYNFRTALPAGTVIDASSPLSDNNGLSMPDGTHISLWSGDDYDFVFGYQIPNESTPGGLDFGWVRVSYTAANNTGSVIEWAIRRDGQGIVVPSAIPEPASFASIAGMALLGFAAVRRRRRAG